MLFYKISTSPTSLSEKWRSMRSPGTIFGQYRHFLMRRIIVVINFNTNPKKIHIVCRHICFLFLMEEQEYILLYPYHQFNYLPPHYKLVACQTSGKFELPEDQRDSPQASNPYHKFNAARKITQQKLSCHGTKNTLVLSPPPPQYYIRLPNQNENLKLVPLWYIFIFIADGVSRVNVPWHEPLNGTKSRSKLRYCRSFVISPLPLVYKAMSEYVGCTGEWMGTL